MAATPELISVLQQVPIFEGLSEVEARAFFEGATRREVAQGQILFHEGDPSDSLLVILEGEVQVTRRSVELARLSRNAVLGEMSILDGAPRSATASAVTSVRLLQVASARVQEQVRASDVSALKVVARLASVMSRRLSLINEKLVERMERSTRREELADFGRILNRWEF